MAEVTVCGHDYAKPVLTSFTRHTPSEATTNAGPLVFLVTFSEAVVNVDAADFAVNSETNATVTGVTGLAAGDADDSYSTYTVTVSGGDLADFNGTVGLDLADGHDITDALGNAPADDEPDTDQTYTLENDDTAPRLTITTGAVDGEVRGPFTANFEFDEAVTGFALADIRIDAEQGEVSDLSADLSPDGFAASFTATVTPTEGRVGAITISVTDDAASDEAGNGNIGDLVTVFYVDESFVETRTRRVIRNFMAHRADVIVTNEPNLVSRLKGRKLGRFSMDSEIGANRSSFDLGFAMGARDLKAILDAGDFAVNGTTTATVTGVEPESADYTYAVAVSGGAIADNAYESRFDVWTTGTWSWSEADTAGYTAGLLHLGADYRLTDNVVVGLLGQIDWVEEHDDNHSYGISGTGWMAGPYVVAQMHDNLILDARAAWGTADNKVTPFTQKNEDYQGAIYTDQFDTIRWLTKAQLTGDFDAVRFNVIPHLAVVYFEEKQEAYTDYYDIAIDSQKVSRGRLTFGPKVSTRFDVGSGLMGRAHMTVSGIWDFDANDTVDLYSGAGSAAEGGRARISSGLSLHSKGGVSFELDSSYDGIGHDGYEAWGGTVRLTIPLQRP